MVSFIAVFKDKISRTIGQVVTKYRFSELK